MRVEPVEVELGERAVEGLRAERPRALALPRLSAMHRHRGRWDASMEEKVSLGRLGPNTQFQFFTQTAGLRHGVAPVDGDAGGKERQARA